MKIKFAILLLSSLLFLSCEEILLGPDAENNPKSNFEILWKTLDENYALFPVKKVNWDSLRIAYGSKITASTAETELWNICAGLIQHLNDGHVCLVNKGVSKIVGASEIDKRSRDEFSLELIKNKFLEERKTAGNGFITYGKIKSTLTNKKIGYIHILSFGGQGSGSDFNWAFDIDKIINELYDTDALILDVRNNGGGLKVTVQIIASAFIDREILYFYQQLKTGPGHNDFGEKIPLTIPTRKDISRFSKNIALLTNRFSGSGSEHLAQIFKNLQYSTQIGDSTLGAFGDVVGNSELPNGWVFWYPVRLTTTPDGKSPEGIGIIPDVLVENTQADISADRDKVMNYAVEFLSKK